MDGVIDQHGGALITGAVAILVALVTAVAATVGERHRERSERATAREALVRDAYAGVLAATGRLGSEFAAAQDAPSGEVRIRALARVSAASTSLFEAAALAMLVGSDRARETVMRLQMAVSAATVAFGDGPAAGSDWVDEWSAAKTDLLDVARREVGGR